MQNVIDSGPSKLFLRRQMRKTGDRLVEVNQAESDIERSDRRCVPAVNNNQATDTEDNVKNIVGGRTAGQTFFFWDDEAKDTDQDEDRRKNREDVKIQI